MRTRVPEGGRAQRFELVDAEGLTEKVKTLRREGLAAWALATAALMLVAITWALR